jgi:hypothetical protein
MARPGPKPKGDRLPATVRAPRRQMVHYREQARLRGISLNDYLVQVLAAAHPEITDEPEEARQQQLKLGA